MKNKIKQNNFIKMRIGKTRLLFPASELLSVESGDQLKQEHPKNTSATIIINDLEIPVYSSDEELNLHSYHDGDWPYYLCLNNGHNYFAIACDEATLIKPEEITYYDLPGCMQCEDSPVHGLTVFNDTVYCNTDTASLYRLLE